MGGSLRDDVANGVRVDGGRTGELAEIRFRPDVLRVMDEGECQPEDDHADAEQDTAPQQNRDRRVHRANPRTSICAETMTSTTTNATRRVRLARRGRSVEPAKAQMLVR